MKTLYLQRHAHAEAGEGIDDHRRELSPRGIDACAQLGAALSNLPAAELALCSSAVRTLQTFENTLPHWSALPRLEVESVLYLAGASEIREVIGRVDPAIDRLLVIGHQPGLQLLALDLTRTRPGDARESAKQNFETAALAVLELPSEDWKLEPRSGTLARFLTPSRASLAESGG